MLRWLVRLTRDGWDDAPLVADAAQFKALACTVGYFATHSVSGLRNAGFCSVFQEGSQDEYEGATVRVAMCAP